MKSRSKRLGRHVADVEEALNLQSDGWFDDDESSVEWYTIAPLWEIALQLAGIRDLLVTGLVCRSKIARKAGKAGGRGRKKRGMTQIAKRGNGSVWPEGA